MKPCGQDDWLTELDFSAIQAQESNEQQSGAAPLVSILMLAWNHAEFIDEAIESVVSQQCNFPFELIIGEDCSADETLSRCQVWQERFPGIVRVVTADRNVGMHRNFARIWHRARGQFIALCEGDDYWVDTTKLQKQVDWFRKQPEGSMVGTFTDRISRSADGEWLVRGRLAPLETKEFYTLEDLLRSYNFHFSSVMLRKDSMQYPRWFWDAYCVDRPLYLLAAQTGLVGLLPIVTSRYRQHPGGLWSPQNPLSKGAASTRLFRQFETHLGKSYANICRQTLAAILWSYMFEAIEAGNREVARKLYWQSLRAHSRGLFTGHGWLVAAAGFRIHFPGIYRALGGQAIKSAEA